MGLDLGSPFIAASCGLTADVEKVKQMAEAGAGAVVLKSLFEEQIAAESSHLVEQGTDYAESAGYVHYFVRQNSLGNYCRLIREIRNAVTIPVIASINCYTDGEWISYAREIENAGADALEINIYSIPLSLSRNSVDIEKEYESVVRKIVSAVKIPVAVKIGSSFTSVPYFADRLVASGARAVVMFNRFYTPDIDIEKVDFVASEPLSDEREHVRELRAIAIASSLVKAAEFSATTGIHTPEAGIKMLLAGASTVQISSVVYKKGPAVFREFNTFLEDYLDRKGYSGVNDIIGKLNYSGIQNPDRFERTQFMKTFGSRK